MVLPVAYNSKFSSAWFGGTAVADSSIVPGMFQVAVNGRPYLLNTDPAAIDSYGDFFREESLPLMRQQADQSDEPGESSVSPSQFWRRSQDSWHRGAGQSMLDRPKVSDALRFNTSKGVNPWTRYQVGLQRDVLQIKASTNTNLFAQAVTNGVVFANGTNVEASVNLSVAATALATGGPGVTVTGMTGDGSSLWVGFGASGIYTYSAGILTSYVTGTVGLLGYVKGRLLAAGPAGQLYNPIAAGALPAAFYTHPASTFSWTAFAEGDAFIYAAGVNGSGRQSRIYRIAVQPDGVGLSSPVVAATLPQGEIIRSMLGYLGFVIVGTDKGVRFATTNTTGDLTLGALIPTPGAVYGLDPGGQFVWFGWGNADATSTGLGRLDMTTINEGLAPAYATDLMAPGQGVIRGIAQLNDRRAFTVDGLGIYGESNTAYVTSGNFTTGQIAYGIADPKVGVRIDLKHQPLPVGNTVAVSASFDRGLVVGLGSSTQTGAVAPPESISVGKRRSEETELTIALTSAGTSDTVLTRWTLLSYPAPAGASMFVLPIMLGQRIDTLRDTEYPMDPRTEYEFLVGLHANREMCTVQVGSESFEGTLEDYTWIPGPQTYDRSWWNGTFVAKLRKITG